MAHILVVHKVHSLAHLHTQSVVLLVRWVASVIDPARKVSQEEHASREKPPW